MGTRNSGTRGLRTTVATCLGVVAGACAVMATQRHSLDALDERLRHLEKQARNQQQANLAMQQRQHWELLSKAIDDPDLAEVLDTYEVPVDARKRRQYLFANALYTNLLCYHRIGNLTRDEFFKYARGVFQNPIVRDYWYATRQQRASIKGTEEAALGQLIDDLLLQLDESDTEEWWVVGDPPADT